MKADERIEETLKLMESQFYGSVIKERLVKALRIALKEIVSVTTAEEIADALEGRS